MKNYQPRACVCKRCAADPEQAVVFKPAVPIQKYADQCLTKRQLQKRRVSRQWADKRRLERAERRKDVHGSVYGGGTARTPIKRCELCADLPHRRPLDGCQLHNGGCGRPYQKEVITP